MHWSSLAQSAQVNLPFRHSGWWGEWVNSRSPRTDLNQPTAGESGGALAVSWGAANSTLGPFEATVSQAAQQHPFGNPDTALGCGRKRTELPTEPGQNRMEYRCFQCS